MERLLIALICLAAGCQSTSYTPPRVTAQMVGRKSRVALETLRKGRTLFASRCIECHTLPYAWRYGAKEWPGIVDSMSKRSGLKPAERDAIVAYLLAVNAKKNN